MRVYGRGIKEVTIRYRAGRENINVDALSRSRKLPAPEVGIAQDEVQVSSMCLAISHTDDGEYPLTSHLPQTLGDSSKIATDNSLASTLQVECQSATPLSLERYQPSNGPTPRDLQVQRVFQETALDKEVPVSVVSRTDTHSCPVLPTNVHWEFGIPVCPMVHVGPHRTVLLSLSICYMCATPSTMRDIGILWDCTTDPWLSQPWVSGTIPCPSSHLSISSHCTMGQGDPMGLYHRDPKGLYH